MSEGKYFNNLNESKKYDGEIVCEKCGNSVNKLTYDRHLSTHREKREETCTICFKKFTNLSNFKYHMSHHSEERPFICNECPKSYKTRVDLIQHKRVHDRAKEPISCEVCHKKFTIRSKYDTHLKCHYKTSQSGPQNCVICNKMFVNLRSHIQQVHDKIRKYKCSICDKDFGKKSGLTRHITTVHEKLKCWSCDLCEKSFGEKTQLKRHKNVHLKSSKSEQQINTQLDGIECSYLIIEPEIDENVLQDEPLQSEIIEEVYLVATNDDTKDCNKEDTFISEESRCEYVSKTDDEYDSSTEIEKLEESEMSKIEILDEYRDALNAELLNEYRCHICSFTFKQKRYYLSHIRTFHSGNNDKSIKCNYCDEKFIHRTQRLRHIRQIHPEIYEENYSQCDQNSLDVINRTCNLCGKIFKKSQYLQLHVANDHKMCANFECDYCQRRFSFKGSMERHIKAIHLDTRDFKCQELSCEKAFRSRYERNEHFNNIHVAKTDKKGCLKKVLCDICDKVCSSRKSLYSHKKLVHERITWSTNFECKICFEKFDTKYKKIKHFHQVHQNGKVIHRICQFCSATFRLHADFKDHIESHENCSICDICGNSFNDSSSLFIHKESHKKIEEDCRQFICDICSHRLSTKAQLQIHMRKHSSENHYYVCDECGKSYKFLPPFIHHQLTHKNNFDFSCCHCKKVFRKRRDKIEHEKIHSTIRPYECHTCHKTFALKPNYFQHIKAHQQQKFECKVCNVILSSSKKLRFHKLNEHPGVN